MRFEDGALAVEVLSIILRIGCSSDSFHFLRVVPEGILQKDQDDMDRLCNFVSELKYIGTSGTVCWALCAKTQISQPFVHSKTHS